MDIDAEKKVFNLSLYEQVDLNLPANQTTWSLDRAADLLAIAEAAQARAEARRDAATTLPSSAGMNSEMALYHDRTARIRGIIRELTPFLPSVADQADRFLQGR